MKQKDLKNLVRIFEKYPQIKLVYFFGSRAKGKSGPMSDYDFAFYLDERESKKVFELKFKLNDEISRLLKTDKIDLVMLDITRSSELKYDVIKNGKLIFEREPYKVLVEPKILNEYFDFMMMLRKYNLTKV
jgi:hypothetical protein